MPSRYPSFVNVQKAERLSWASHKAEDGGLAFATVVNDTDLILWSIDTGPNGAMGWSKVRVIDLKTLVPDDALWIPTLGYGSSSWPGAVLIGFAEGTQVIFVRVCTGSYMVDLKSGRVRKVSHDHRRGQTCFPYVNFYIPGITYVHIYNHVQSFVIMCQ